MYSTSNGFYMLLTAFYHNFPEKNIKKTKESLKRSFSADFF